MYSYIFDECHCPIARCVDLSQDEVEEILEEHPEWYISCSDNGSSDELDFLDFDFY